MKQRESIEQRRINGFRDHFEEACGIPLKVQLVGPSDDARMTELIKKLVAADLQSKPLGHHLVLDSGDGLRSHITKGFRSEWYNVDSRIGWVDQNPLPTITAAIASKAAELPRYRAAAGEDVRLLLVADHTYASGKLGRIEPGTIDTMGFTTVYFSLIQRFQSVNTLAILTP